MSEMLFGQFPSSTTAYYTDGTHKFYGWAAKGSKTSDPRWKIMKMEYTGDNWITKYPDGTDAPKFVWDDVASLTFELLGT